MSPRRRPAVNERAARKRDSYKYRKLKDRYRAKCAAHAVPCHLCGMPIDYSLPSGEDPNSFEVDHFYNVDDYPELFEDVANFRPSHKDCNASRGKDDVTPTLGTPSEAW